MKAILVVPIALSIVGIVIVAVTALIIFHFRKDNHNDLSINRTTTITTQKAVISSTTNAKNSTIVTGSSTMSSSTIISGLSITTSRTTTTTTTNKIGNSSTVSSTYLVNLTDHSPTMSPDINPSATTYFEAVEISVSVNGTYNITSIGSLDTVGYLFINSFNISFQSINLLIRNDDGADRNFGMSYRLGASQKYFLLATTYNSRITGSFQISISGPSAVNFIKMNVSNSTFATGINSYYSSALTNQSLTFCRLTVPCDVVVFYYYKLIELSISVDGTYFIISNSSQDTYGYLYQAAFNPANISQNLLLENDDGGGNRQFSLVYELHAMIKYFLVITTYGPATMGVFSIIAYGSGVVNFIV